MALTACQRHPFLTKLSCLRLKLSMLYSTRLHWDLCAASSAQRVELNTKKSPSLCPKAEPPSSFVLFSQLALLPKRQISYTSTLLKLLTLSWHPHKHIREGQLKYQRVVETSVVLKQQLPTVLYQSRRCVEWQGSALHELFLFSFMSWMIG